MNFNVGRALTSALVITQPLVSKASVNAQYNRVEAAQPRLLQSSCSDTIRSVSFSFSRACVNNPSCPSGYQIPSRDIIVDCELGEPTGFCQQLVESVILETDCDNAGALERAVNDYNTTNEVDCTNLSCSSAIATVVENCDQNFIDSETYPFPRGGFIPEESRDYVQQLGIDVLEGNLQANEEACVIDEFPTRSPVSSPSVGVTNEPSSEAPTQSPKTQLPTKQATEAPTQKPSQAASSASPSERPSSNVPTQKPSQGPTSIGLESSAPSVDETKDVDQTSASSRLSMLAPVLMTGIGLVAGFKG